MRLRYLLERLARLWVRPMVKETLMDLDLDAEDQAARTRARIALEEAITSHAATAHRLPYVVARMDADPRTKWDLAHKRIDELLTLRELTE